MTEHQTSLRPRSIGELLDDTFRQYRADFAFLMLAGSVILIPYLLVNGLINVNASNMLSSLPLDQKNVTSDELLQAVRKIAWPYVGLAIVQLISALVVTPLLFGSIVHRVKQGLMFGRLVPFQQAFLHAVSRWGATVVAQIVRAVLLGAPTGVVGTAFVLSILPLRTGNPRALVGVVIGMGFVWLGLMCLTVWLLVRFSLTIPSAMEETGSLWRPISRSWRLTRRNFWRTFGFFIVIYLISGAAQAGIGFIVALLGNPVLSTVFSSLLALFITPFGMLAASNLYVDLVVRTDALDRHNWLPPDVRV